MTTLFVVTAHTSRLEAARKLCVDLNALMVLDDGTLGEPGNTRRALKLAQYHPANHVVVVQDDAQPVPGFRDLAQAAINERPKSVISYYLGTGRPVQKTIAALVENADANGDRWIDTTRLFWGVAWSMPTALLPGLNEWLAQRTGPTDTETGHWARFNRIPCTHTWPCLVDHEDSDSLIHDRTESRKAWRLLDEQPA